MPSGVVSNELGLLRGWGGIPQGHPQGKQTAAEL